MNRLLKIAFAIFALASICYGEEIISEVTGEATAETTPAEELTKDEIYNINTDMYCITDKIIKENALDLIKPRNLYTSILDDDIKDIDCEAILEEYVLRVHKRLRKDFKKKGASNKTLDCFMNKIVELGYDQMRFKFNALYGIDLEAGRKEQLRKAIDKEIGDTVETAVDECWVEDSTSPKAAESKTNF